MTAEEYLKNKYNVESSSEIALRGSLLTKELIEFAKYHVEKALKEASEARAISMLGNNWYKYTLNPGTTILADINIELHKESILNAYPLELIV